MPTKKTLSDLKSAVSEKEAAAPSAAPAAHVPGAATTAPQERVQTLDAKGRAYGTGRRKDAVARVWISRGSGKIVVNDRDVIQYFARGTQRLVINQPFETTARVGQFDVGKAVVFRRRTFWSGRRCAPWPFPRARPLRAGSAHRPQEGRLPDPRQPYRRT